MANKQTMKDLQELQALPLNLKVSLTKQRLREWVNYWGEDGVFISFSGGKDSTVLLDIARKQYPRISAIFCDTGLEYPELREFVKKFDNVTWLKPKMNFKEVLCKYGYPMISKEVAECVDEGRKYLLSLGYKRTDKLSELDDESIPDNFDKWKFGKPYRYLEIIGKAPAKCKGKILEGEYSKLYDRSKYRFMLDAPFNTTKYCCNLFKKSLSHKYSEETGKKPITATTAAESKLRTAQWIQHSCNGFEMNHPISNPMSFWTEQDVLQYVFENSLPLAPVYGDVVADESAHGGLEGQTDWATLGIFDIGMPTFHTTGCDRTGCIFCGFGATHDVDRYVNIAKVSNPAILDFCMRGGAFDRDGVWKPDATGLGYWFVLKWINIHGNFDVKIPNFEEYEKKYGNEYTHKYLYGEE